MSSGVPASDACKIRYEEVKKDKKYRYVIYFIKDEKQIDVEILGDRDASYDDFIRDLTKNIPDAEVGECRYGLYDLEYSHQCQGTTEATKKQKLFLMQWSPDRAKIRQKMVYTSSFDVLKKLLVGVHKTIQATDSSEYAYKNVEEILRSTDRN